MDPEACGFEIHILIEICLLVVFAVKQVSFVALSLLCVTSSLLESSNYKVRGVVLIFSNGDPPATLEKMLSS